MMKTLTISALVASAAAFAPAPQAPVSTSALSANKFSNEIGAQAPLGFWDPMGFLGNEEQETFNWIREAEIKHGRIAMFAFVGYLAHANGVTFPWAMTMSGEKFPTGLTPPEAWDAIPDAGKLQIFLFVGFLEFWREVASETHYMKGGKPGYFPPFDAKFIPGGALNLYDPFGRNKGMTEEQKATGLLRELNNGRLAQLGIFGFLCESKIPGSVPALKGIIPAYDGDYMAPLAKSILPHL